MSAPQPTPQAAEGAGPSVLDALGAQGRDPLIESYEQLAREDIAAAGTLDIGPNRAARERRLHLLNALPLGDLSGKVCVDFGVGSHGFAASFPKLHSCGRAIGIDFSLAALRASAEVSAAGHFPYGRNHSYLTSRGDRIELADGSVDVVYAGESVERVENVDALLEEIHRILKPEGLLVLTTVQARSDTPYVPPAPPPPPVAPPPPPLPVAAPVERRRTLIARLTRLTPRKVLSRVGRMVRRQAWGSPPAPAVTLQPDPAPPPPPAPIPEPPAELVDEEGTPASEHLGALSYADLCRSLTPRFDLLEAHGYGGLVSGAPSCAPPPDPPGTCRGVVLLARKRPDYRPEGRYQQRRHAHDALDIHYRGGPWRVVPLRRALTGRAATAADTAWMTLPVEGSGLVLHFWANPWSGKAIIEVDEVRRTVNLYSAVGRFQRVLIDGLAPGRHELRISGSPDHDPRSHGKQVIFHQAIAYGRTTSHGQRLEANPGPVRPPRTAAECARLRQILPTLHWFHTIDLGDGIVTPGCDNSAAKVGYLGLPERLDGLSVLDIGAYNGFFSFECERRGARRVVATDHYIWTFHDGINDSTRESFDLARSELGARVADAYLPVEEISPQRVGVFDLVLFLGVLYHAPDMIGYLERVRSVCRGQLILETEVDAEDYPVPAAVFYPGKSLNKDVTNFWGPNSACVEAMLHKVGFRKVERVSTFNLFGGDPRPFHRAVFHAFV